MSNEMVNKEEITNELVEEIKALVLKLYNKSLLMKCYL